jgi:hypothetical protein
MKARTIAIYLGLAAAAGIGGFAGYEENRAQTARRATVALESRLREAQARLRRLDRQLEETMARLAAHPPVVTSKANGPETKVTKPLGFDAVQWAREYDARQKDPDVQLAKLARIRGQLKLEYGPLYRQLGLSPDEIAKFETNVMNSREKLSDLGTAIVQAGVSFDDPKVREMYRPISDEFRIAQQQLLDESRYQQFGEYERMKDARSTTEQFAAEALLDDMPLTITQADQLARTMANASANFRRGSPVLSDIDWSAVDAGAAGFLTQAQSKLLRGYEPPRSAQRWAQLYALVKAARNADPRLGAGSSP